MQKGYPTLDIGIISKQQKVSSLVSWRQGGKLNALAGLSADHGFKTTPSLKVSTNVSFEHVS